MKSKSRLAFFAVVISFSIFSINFSCKENKPPASAERTLSDTTLTWCENVANLAKNYEDTLIMRYEKFNPAIPIGKGVGVTYMNSYQTEINKYKLDTTSVIFLSDEELSFYLRYSIKYKTGGIGLALAKYDKQALINNNYTDPVLNEIYPEKNGRYTVVVGLRPKNKPGSRMERFLDPFGIGAFNPQKNMNDSLYDDWHELWP
jgi:hypothetical protein